MDNAEYICTQCYYVGPAGMMEMEAVGVKKKRNLIEFFCGFGKIGGLLLAVIFAAGLGLLTMEAFAFWIFLLPVAGLIYMAYKYDKGKKKATELPAVFSCPVCKNKTLIPVDSPRGKSLKEQVQGETA